jgi:hypothetical protein
LIEAVAGLLIAAGTAAWIGGTGADLGPVAAAVAAVTWALLALGTGFAVPALMTLGAAGLVGAYGLSRIGHSGLDAGAAVLAVVLLVAFDLVIGSLEARRRVPGWSRRRRDDWTRLSLRAAAAGTVAAAVLFTATVPLQHGIFVQAAGAAAAAGLLAFLVALRRSPD